MTSRALSEIQLLRRSIPMNLFFFANNLINTGINEGQHADTLSRACCELSHFSCNELDRVFSSEGTIFKGIARQLKEETLNLIGGSVSSLYTTISSDSLPFLLPLIHKRRQRTGITRGMRSSVLFDLMHTVEKAFLWKPSHGPLILSLEDVKKGHHTLRTALDDLHSKGRLVTRKGDVKKKRITYEFDVFGLMSVFTEKCSIGL